MRVNTLRAALAAALFLSAPSLGPSQGDAPRAAPARAALSTEDFLDRLGVNTHLDGLTRADPWDTDPARVGAELKYLGVRLDRDWAHSPDAGRTWRAVQKAWGPYGRFWTSIDEGGPADQRRALADEQAAVLAFPGLICAMGGPNEEDDAYAQGLGATLPDSAGVQKSLFAWAHAGGRDIPTSQMEFGAGWTAGNGWRGDYDPGRTGIHQDYTPGPADLGAAHTYLHMPGQRPADVLDQLRALARLTTPGRPVAHTEFGAYRSAALSAAVYGQFLVMGACDSMAAGDAAFIVYGLQDSGPEGTYGFYTATDHAAHPAAADFHTLTALLASAHGGYAPGAARTFTPGRLAASFTGPTARHLVMQKPTGEFVIADWSEQAMDGLERDETDTVRFGGTFATVRVYDVERGTQPLAVLGHAARYTLRMTPGDTYLLVLSRTADPAPAGKARRGAATGER